MNWLGLPFCLVGAAVLVAGLSLARNRFPILLRGRPIRGTIRRWRHRLAPPGSPARAWYVPEVTYLDPLGNEHAATIWQGRPTREPATGSEFPLVFDPRRPHIAYDGGLPNLLVIPLVIVLGGALTLLIGLGVLFG